MNSSKTLDIEKRLRNEKNKEKIILDSIPGGVAVYHIMKDGRIPISDISNGLAGICGYTAEEFLEKYGHNSKECVVEDDLPIIGEAIKTMLKTGKPIHNYFRLYKKDGSIIYTRFDGNVIESENSSDDEITTLYAVQSLISDIDDIKKMQLKLEYNQKSIEFAQKCGNMSIWTFNIDKKIIIQQNYSYDKGHMGYSAHIEDVPNCFFETKSIHPDDEKKFMAVYDKLFDNEESVDEVYRLKNYITGNYDWIHMYYKRVYNDIEKDRMAVGYSIVINQQQENLEHYIAEQQLRKKLFSNAMQYFEFNLTKKQIENYECLDIKEKNYKSLKKQSIRLFEEKIQETVEPEFIPSLKKLFSENLIKAFQNGETKVICEYRRKTTEYESSFWVKTTVNMAQRPDSNDIMAFVYVENINEEKKYRLALDSTIENSVESIAILNVKSQMLNIIKMPFNIMHEVKKTKFLYSEVFLNQFGTVIDEKEKEVVIKCGNLENVLKNLSNNAIYQYPISISRIDGVFRRKLFRYKYLDKYKEDIVIVISDITELYIQEEKKKQQLQIAVDEAVSANKAKTDFLARMSHDIRTPLNVIIGMNRLALENDNPKDTQELLNKINISSQFLLGLINDVLDMEKIESGKIEIRPIPYTNIEFKQYIETVIVPLCHEKEILFDFSISSEDSFTIMQDKLRINQVYFNLLSNAVKFTPEGGSVKFATKAIFKENTVELNVTISDSGIGMSEEFQKYMFDPFTQENQNTIGETKGNGLGLAIVKRMCDLMGMTISVKSKLGEGTTFYIHGEFERVEQHNTSTKIKEKKSSDLSILKNKMVLVCEDHMLNQEIIRRVLEKVGIVVVIMDDGQKGINAFMNSTLNEYSAILMDIRMPVLNGLEAAKKIRSLNRADAKTVPIIAMTANAFDSDIRDAMNAGMNEHLSKPIIPDLLYKTLAGYISEFDNILEKSMD